MSCPTCDHTMHSLRGGGFWCPRCGTLRECSETGFVDDTAPKLVERCRVFADLHIPATSGYAELWARSGIAKSIDLPGDRPAS